MYLRGSLLSFSLRDTPFPLRVIPFLNMIKLEWNQGTSCMEDPEVIHLRTSSRSQRIHLKNFWRFVVLDFSAVVFVFKKGFVAYWRHVHLRSLSSVSVESQRHVAPVSRCRRLTVPTVSTHHVVVAAGQVNVQIRTNWVCVSCLSTNEDVAS
jgi:hypothetical protein